MYINFKFNEKHVSLLIINIQGIELCLVVVKLFHHYLKKKKFSKAHVIQKLKVLTMLQLKAIERYNNDDTIKHRDLIVYIQMRI